MTARITAPDRLRRILAIAPWVAVRDGPTVEEITERFGVTPKDLLADLEVLWMVGVPPYTPDTMIDVVIEGGRVWINLGDYFRRPLRLNTTQGLALLAAGSAFLRDRGGDESDSPLSRGLEKLRHTLGLARSESVEVDLGPATSSALDLLERAVAEGRQVEIDYYSYGKDEHTVRVIDPYQIQARDGNWYLSAWCHLVDGERLFRVDRIGSATELESTFDPPEELPEPAFRTDRVGARVTLRLRPAAGWVAEQYPVEETRPLPDGGVEVQMAIAGSAWLARLLLRLGPDAEIAAVTGMDEDLVRNLAVDTARRLLGRYGTALA